MKDEKIFGMVCVTLVCMTAIVTAGGVLAYLIALSF